MLALFVAQVAREVSVRACSKEKSAVSTDGQERMLCDPRRETESAGRGRGEARAMHADTFPPAVLKSPPAYRSLPEIASASTASLTPEPNDDQSMPSHLAM